ncbi:MAG: restriction endonuclease subunit S [Candidatus Onthomorpha sp.]
MRKTINIGDLGTIITGKTPPTTNKSYYGDYAVFIKPTDISEQSKYTYETEEMYSKLAAEKYESSLIPKGAICVPCIGTIGTKMTMAPCDCYTNQSINSIICNENYDNEYVYYLIKNFLPGLKAYNLGTASGREYVSKSNFEKIELVAEQDKEIQKKIGVILSRYDSLIENYQKQIKLLEEAARRLYKEWFIDLRFPGHENTKIVDGLPEGWERKSVGEIGEYLNGFAFKPSDWQELGKPIIKIKEMGNGVTNDTPRNNGERVPAKYLIKAGDLLFSWSATLMVIIWSGEDGWLNQHLFKVTPAKGINREFLLQSISNTIVEFQNLTTGSTMKHIQRNKLDQVFVNVPNAEIMKRYTDISEKTRSNILSLQSQLRLLTEARDRLLPKLMSGEITV